MEFNRAIDGLPRIVNILFSIFLPIIHVIYAVIKDVTDNNTIAVVLDIISFVFGLIVYWVLNLIWVLTKEKIFTWAEFVQTNTTTYQAKEEKEDK